MFKGLTLAQIIKLIWALAVSFYYEKFLKIQTYRLWDRNGNILFIGLMSKPYYARLKSNSNNASRVRSIVEVFYCVDPKAAPGGVLLDNFTLASFYTNPYKSKGTKQ